MFEKPPKLISLDTIDSLCDLSNSLVTKKQVTKKSKVVTKKIKKEVPKLEVSETTSTKPQENKVNKKTKDNIKWL